MKVFYKYILLWFLPLFLFSVEDIDSLLDNYTKESAFDIKTKMDSAGHNIVYTRNELDKMQAHTLKDILKSIRHLTMMDNNLGAVDIQR